MDSIITAAARLLATGDLLGALKRVALRDDAPALALRGIAMAQLGDLVRAKALLKQAARGLRAEGGGGAGALRRCRGRNCARLARPGLAGEVARGSARTTLEAHGDKLNAAHARHLEVRRLLLIGHLDEAERLLAELDPTPFLPPSRTAYELVVAGIAIRRAQGRHGARAHSNGRKTPRVRRAFPALAAEVESASRVLTTPAARLIAGRRGALPSPRGGRRAAGVGGAGGGRLPLSVRDDTVLVSLTTRPVLFALARALAESWPVDVSRRCARRPRVPGEGMPTNRTGLACASKSAGCAASFALADINATKQGFVLARTAPARSSCWRRRSTSQHGACSPFLPTAKSWSSSALAIALGASPRTVQRALDALAARQSAVLRPRTGAALDDPARAGIPDNIVTPRSAAERLG